MSQMRKLKKKVSPTVQSTQHLLVKTKTKTKKLTVNFEIFSRTFKNQELPLRTLPYSWIYRKSVALSVCNTLGELFYSKPLFKAFVCVKKA